MIKVAATSLLNDHIASNLISEANQSNRISLR
jgi:hypothetical protein